MLLSTHRSCDVGVESVEERDESLHVHPHGKHLLQMLRNQMLAVTLTSVLTSRYLASQMHYSQQRRPQSYHDQTQLHGRPCNSIHQALTQKVLQFLR